MMEILESEAITALDITKDACERYDVRKVKLSRGGYKHAALLAEGCSKVLNLDGTYSWQGDYDPNFGLFGQKACIPGEPIVIVPTELEVLKLASVGTNAVCLSDPKALDSVTLSVLEENLKTVSTHLRVWPVSTFDKRQRCMEKFLLHLAKGGKFKIEVFDKAVLAVMNIKKTQMVEVLATETSAWKPRGIQFTDEIINSGILQKPVRGVGTGYQCLDTASGGFRPAELTMFTAGTGVGKSTIVREIAYHLGCKEGEKVGMIFLEELPQKTLSCLAAIRFDTPVHILRKTPDVISQDKWAKFNSDPNIRKNFVFYNHFGSLEADELFNKIEYMVDFCGCRFICLDHISIAVSGMSSKEGERKDIDILMTRLVQLAVAKEIHIIAITHLSSPDGTPHEEGGRVTLNQLRGSKSISQLSMNIFALERNQQEQDSTRALVRALKCREVGTTAPIGVVNYDVKTGRLLEDFQWDPKDFEGQMQPKKQFGKGAGNYGNKGGSGVNFAGGY